MKNIFIIHSSMDDRHLEFFYFLVIVKMEAMHMYKEVSL